MFPICCRSTSPRRDGRSRRWRAGIAAAFATLCGCTELPPSAGAAAPAAIAAGAARIWVYRDYEPYETLARPYVRLNGRIVAISEPGGSLYRDVPPGAYRVTIDSDGQDINQFADVVLAAGQTAYIKVESSNQWESSLSYQRDTFYTRPILPGTAKAELARSRFYGGG